MFKTLDTYLMVDGDDVQLMRLNFKLISWQHHTTAINLKQTANTECKVHQGYPSIFGTFLRHFKEKEKYLILVKLRQN